MAKANRPRFEPFQWHEDSFGIPPLLSQFEEQKISWIPVISSFAYFPIELFESAMMEIIYHPEYNSTLILRADITADSADSEALEHLPQSGLKLSGFYPTRLIERTLLARRPERDPSIKQTCSFWMKEAADHVGATPVLDDAVLVLTPLLPDGQCLPYYHPKVSRLAFRYIGSPALATLRIEVYPLATEPVECPVDPTSRLYRTCLALLDASHRYGLGKLQNYQKRVLHDCIIPRNDYQDFYLIMRDRHKHLVENWQESTDPLKHVFEDIAIATYVMLLWKDSFPPVDLEKGNEKDKDARYVPWNSWGRPAGGFIDVGCGNGLLTYILLTEGYLGHGFDVRSRTSWEFYPESVQKCLHVHTFDPAHLKRTPADIHMSLFPPGVFVIANHADELTPWAPIISILASTSGYLSIPCCAWYFDRRYVRERDDASELPEGQISKLNFGPEGQNSSYARYRAWLAGISWQCGWEIECDTLRIPSTRNWCILGRRQVPPGPPDGVNKVTFCLDILDQVERRGLWEARKAGA